LLVDDDHSFRRLAGLMLERRGFHVLSASSGEASIEWAHEADVALVDMVMPGMSGVETIPHLRERNPRIRVIASSGCSQELFRAGLEQVGVDHFLSKPYPIERLIAEIESLASEPAQAAAG
jgi:CheY-like chemotaxis protein